jgi:hypothetical protein
MALNRNKTSVIPAFQRICHGCIRRPNVSKRALMKAFVQTLLWVLVSVLAGCHKHDNQYSYSYGYIDSRLESQEFKIGSYWIFQNDSTKQTDCTYIQNVLSGFYDGGNHISGFYKEEYYDMIYFYSNSVNLNEYDRDRVENRYIMRNPVDYYQNIQRGPLIYSLNNDTSLLYIDSLRVGHLTFSQVQKATINYTEYYTAKSIGLVKKIVHDSIYNGVWNLIRWKTCK